jgi:ubiquinone/menaquinone biosynthesis C-methylase UbiE
MSTQHAPTTEEIRASWDAIAPRFDEFITPENIGVSKEILHRLDVRPGTRLLEVAAGSGALSIPAARLGADVVATDISPVMIERLTARARAEELTNVEGLTMDGTSLDLDDDAFDVAVSVNGVSLFPDIARGLSEVVRVTRPGGRVAITAFGPLPKAEFIVFFMGALQAAVPGFTPLPADPPPLPFQVADPGVLRSRLTDAGLHDVAISTITWEMHARSAQHFWDAVTSSNPIGAALVADLDGEQRADVLRVVDGMLRERSGGSPGAVLYAELNLGVGTV